MTDVALLEWAQKRFEALRKLPESEYEAIYDAWARGRREIEHFFVSAVDDEGIVFWPQSKEAGAQSPARFRALPCIATSTRDLFSGLDQSGR
jgi:hypothetical protein